MSEVHKPGLSEYQRTVLANQNVLSLEQSETEFYHEVAESIFSVEFKFGTPQQQIMQLEEQLVDYMTRKVMTPGMPTLRNLNQERTLSSCTVIPVDLDAPGAEETIKAYYRLNMGSGYNLSSSKDPVSALHRLNNLADEETKTKKYERRIANMVTLPVTHHRAKEFIMAKREDGILP